MFNINSGARFTTYAIEAPRDSSVIAANGAAARLVQTGDKVIILAYCQIPAEEARNYRPSVLGGSLAFTCVRLWAVEHRRMTCPKASLAEILDQALHKAREDKQVT